jgi:hypothetical protein
MGQGGSYTTGGSGGEAVFVRPGPLSGGAGPGYDAGAGVRCAIHARDEHHCVISRRVNPEVAADLADGGLVPDRGWLPFSASLAERDTGVPGLEGRVDALVPSFARTAWLGDPARRPFLPVPAGAPTWFRLPDAPAADRSD